MEVPLGETDLEPVGVDVDAKREETEALEARYGNVDIEDAIDRESIDPLTFDNLKDEGAGGSGGSKVETLLGGVMKRAGDSSTSTQEVYVVALWPRTSAGTCAWIEVNLVGIQDLANNPPP